MLTLLGLTLLSLVCSHFIVCNDFMFTKRIHCSAMRKSWVLSFLNKNTFYWTSIKTRHKQNLACAILLKKPWQFSRIFDSLKHVSYDLRSYRWFIHTSTTLNGYLLIKQVIYDTMRKPDKSIRIFGLIKQFLCQH